MSTNEICNEFGARFKALRLAKNLTQEQLAIATQASPSSIRRMEMRGQATLALMVKVAQTLRATDDLQNLFMPTMQSIAQIENQLAITTRQRASRKRKTLVVSRSS